MDRRRNRQRFAGQVDAGEDLAALGNARQALAEHGRINVVEVQVDVVFLGAHAAAFAHLERHRTRNDVAAGEVLRAGRIALHEALALGIGQIAALAACALGDEHARTVDARRVELDEFHVLQRQAGAQHHAAAIAGAGMRAGGGEVAPAIAARRQHHSLGTEAVDRAVVEAHGDHADAFLFAVRPGLHDQVEREIFDEEVGVVLEALLVERVQHGVAGTVGGGAGALHRRAFAHVLHVPAEGALVDRAVVIAAEGHAGMFEFVDRLRRLAHEIFDRVLVAQPVGALDGIVHVPRPVVGGVVAEAGGDPALRGDGVRTRREDLGDVGSLETAFGGAHRGAQARTARADDYHVIGVVGDRIFATVDAESVVPGHQAAPPRARRAIETRPKAPPPMVARLRRASVPNLVPASWT